MFLNRRRNRFFTRVKTVVAQSNHFSVIELEAGEHTNIVLLQPIDEASQVGTDEETVQRFLAMIRKKLSSKHKKGVEFAVKSKPSGHLPDYTESQPDFATPQKIYFLEIRFRN